MILARPQTEPALGRGSNYPPFQNRWPRYRRAGHRNRPICVELWEVHVSPPSTEIWLDKRCERQTWLSGIINHSLCPRWRGGGTKSQRGNKGWGGESCCADCSRIIIHRIVPWALLQKWGEEAANTFKRGFLTRRHDHAGERLLSCSQISPFLCASLANVKKNSFCQYVCHIPDVSAVDTQDISRSKQNNKSWNFPILGRQQQAKPKKCNIMLKSSDKNILTKYVNIKYISILLGFSKYTKYNSDS